ncbi:MAG: phasin family protein [Phycisphaerae bacterium]|nr:phasin family protein [Phycisphaerae bacterium]
MIDLMKKTLLTGVGLGLMTKDKVEEIAREIANAAQLSTDKGQEFVDEAVARAKKGREDLEATVQRLVSESFKKADLPTREDLAELTARLEKLEQHCAAQHD